MSDAIVVDPDPKIREVLTGLLTAYKVQSFDDGAKALSYLRGGKADLAVVGYELASPLNAMEVIRGLRELKKSLPIILTIWGFNPDQVSLVRAWPDIPFEEKPLRSDRFAKTLQDLLCGGLSEKEKSLLKKMEGKILGESEPVRRLRYELVMFGSRSRRPVLVVGETGTGKELVAEAIAELDPMGPLKLFPVHSGGIASATFESHLFGHKKGAFTHALYNRKGMFETASGGVLFLDEIATLDPELQLKLLRVLEDQTYQKVGDDNYSKTNCRIVAATNRNLMDMIKRDEFREDLYQRLAVHCIICPPLRDRGNDLELLGRRFAANCNKTLSDEAIKALKSHPWKKNIRELLATINDAVVRSNGAEIGVKPLLEHFDRENASTLAEPIVLGDQREELLGMKYKDAMARVEGHFIHDYFLHKWEANDKNVEKAAIAAGVNPSTFRNKWREAIPPLPKLPRTKD